MKKKQDKIKQMRDQPMPTSHVLFHDGKWFCWRINNIPSLFERKIIKDKYVTIGYDFLPHGPISEKPAKMPLDKWQDLQSAVEFALKGMT